MSDHSETPPANEARFHCWRGHKWRKVLDLPMDVREFGRLMAANAECPTCGARAFLGWKNAPTTLAEPVD